MMLPLPYGPPGKLAIHGTLAGTDPQNLQGTTNRDVLPFGHRRQLGEYEMLSIFPHP